MSASRNNRKKFDHDRHSPAYGRDRGAGPIRTRRRGLIVAAVSVAMVVAGLSVGIEASGALSGSASPTTSTGATGTGTSTTADPTLSTIPSGPSQTQAPGLRTPGGASPGKGAFNDVACPDATKCLAVGADATGVGVVSSSGDGGSSWSNVAVPPSTSTLNAIACGDASDCVAAGEGTLLATHDGGTTWSRTVPPTADTTLLGVACTGAKVCLASGVSPNPGGPYWGQLLRSVDAGSTWTPISLPMGTLGIGGVTCPTSSLCIAVGAGIYVSADGGATWQERTVANGTGALRSISCSTALHCVAIGPNPAGLYHPDAPAIAVSTNDGGQTWQQLAFPAKTGSLERDRLFGSEHLLCRRGQPRGKRRRRLRFDQRRGNDVDDSQSPRWRHFGVGTLVSRVQSLRGGGSSGIPSHHCLDHRCFQLEAHLGGGVMSIGEEIGEGQRGKGRSGRFDNSVGSTVEQRRSKKGWKTMIGGPASNKNPRQSLFSILSIPLVFALLLGALAVIDAAPSLQSAGPSGGQKVSVSGSFTTYTPQELLGRRQPIGRLSLLHGDLAHRLGQGHEHFERARRRSCHR